MMTKNMKENGFVYIMTNRRNNVFYGGVTDSNKNFFYLNLDMNF